MAGKRHTATVYRADLLWSFSAITEDQQSRSAALLGFELKKPPEQEPAQKTTGTPNEERDTETVQPPPQADIPQAKSQTSSYYRIIDRQVDAEKMATAEDRPAPPEWFTQAKPTYFAETQTRIPAMHRVQPEFPPLVAWPRLWPLLQRVLGADVPGTRPDLSKLVKQVSQGEQIYRIPNTTRYTWSPTARLLIDINDSNFPYRQDFIRLQQQLIVWRGEEGLEIHYIYDEPGGTIARYDGGHEILEPWRSPAQETPFLIVSDLGMHSKSRRSVYQWLVFGQKLNLQGIRPTVLMPVAERQVDKRLLRYFDCIIWDGNTNLKPIQGDEQTGQSPANLTASVEDLLVLLFPALRVELGLLRAMRHLLPASRYDVGHEVDVWNHAAVNPAGDEWGWQAGCREQYRQAFKERFEKLSTDDQQKLIGQIGRYHARLPDELYFEAMYELIRLGVPVPDEVKTATLDFMSMLVKTYQAHPEHQGLDLWVKRYLDRHDHPAQRNEHQIAFMAIERIRRHQQDNAPIEWPNDIDLEQLKPFFNQRYMHSFAFFLQSGMGLELWSQPHASPIFPPDNWGHKLIVLKQISQKSNTVILCYPAKDGTHQQFTINIEADTPYRFSLPPGIHQLQIAEEHLIVEVESSDDKPGWVYSRGVDSYGMFVETVSKIDKIYRWYWHSPEIGEAYTSESLNGQTHIRLNQLFTLPGFWYDLPPPDFFGLKPEWADTAFRDQYGLCADVNIAGVTQRFRWIQPGSFVMGSPKVENGRANDETLHQVNLSQGYWLADTACTQALWQAIMRNNPSDFKGENLPVNRVSWNDVHRFLQKLNQQHPGLTLRLPSEAEWEYACRAGTTGAFNFDGELSLDKVNYRGTWEYVPDKWGEGALQQTAEVKQYPANAWGLYEMHGNVWECCQDWYGSYPAQLMTDPTGPDTGDRRVLRGGSWFEDGSFCRSADRRNRSPGGVYDDTGFRLARGHQSGQSTSGAGQQPAGTHAAAARGAQTGDGLRDAGAKPKGINTGAKKPKSMIESIKDFFKK